MIYNQMKKVPKPAADGEGQCEQRLAASLSMTTSVCVLEAENAHNSVLCLLLIGLRVYIFI